MLAEVIGRHSWVLDTTERGLDDPDTWIDIDRSVRTGMSQDPDDVADGSWWAYFHEVGEVEEELVEAGRLVGKGDLMGRVSAVRGIFSFPNPVDEVSARLVAAGVVAVTLAILVAGQTWLIAPLAYGFVARVLTGPTLSPLGQLVTRVVTPLLPTAAKPVAGPPKRFAQGIGATLSLSAAVAHFGFGATPMALALVGAIAVAATLESVFGFCLGCKAFALLMRAGIVPEEVCEACNDLSRRRPAPI